MNNTCETQLSQKENTEKKKKTVKNIFLVGPVA